MAEIKIRTPDVTPIVDILRSDGNAICQPREQTASWLRVTDPADVMAVRTNPHRRVLCTRLLTAIQFTTANHYTTLRPALGRPKAVRLQTDAFQ
jgi:hypothetical protein